MYRETISDVANRLIIPLLMQPTETPYYITFNMNGAGSPSVGRIGIEKERGSFQEQVGKDEYRVIAVIKPGQKKEINYRDRKPSYPFVKGLEHYLSQEEESRSPKDYRKIGQEFPDIPFDELPNHLGGVYKTYGDELGPEKSGLMQVAHADGPGVYLPNNSYENHSETGWVDSAQDASEIERIQKRVARSVAAITLEEELYEREALEVVKGLANVIVRDAISKRIDLKKLRVKPSGFAYVHGVRQGDSAEISVGVSMLTGLETKTGQVISDHKYLSSVLKGLKRIDGIGPYDGLHFERRRDPEITDLTKYNQPNKPPYPYLVRAVYIAKLSKDAVSAVYQEQKQLAA